MLLNVNVPDLPYEALRGIEVTRLGKRHRAEGVIKTTNPRGETVYWIGAAGAAASPWSARNDAIQASAEFQLIANSLVEYDSMWST